MIKVKKLLHLPTLSLSILSRHKVATSLASASIVLGLPVFVLAVGSDSSHSTNLPSSQSLGAHSEPKPENKEAVPPQSQTQSTSVSSTASVTSSGNNTSTEVTVNGQSIDVPANGNVQTTIPSEDGGSHINVNIQSNQQGSTSNSSRSSSRLNIRSNSTTNISEDIQ